MNRVGHLLVGPPEHGVVRFGADLLAALAALAGLGPVVRTHRDELAADPARVLAPLRECLLVHTQYTDRLFGERCEDAASLVERTAAVLGTAGHRLSVTLHDLPGTDEETPPHEVELRARRAAVYRRIVAAFTGVVVSSQHEWRRLGALIDRPVRGHVVPLPVRSPADRPLTATAGGDVVVLGYLYPGKGHDEVLNAMSGLPAAYGLTALGRPSDGHGDLVAELQRRAATAGRCLRITGFVPETELAIELQRAGVPVAPHRQVSASGSIATWLGAGRRPLVPDVPYTRELAERCPGAVWRYGGEASLGVALREAAAEPERTWLDGAQLSPSPEEAAAAYARILQAWC